MKITERPAPPDFHLPLYWWCQGCNGKVESEDCDPAEHVAVLYSLRVCPDCWNLIEQYILTP